MFDFLSFKSFPASSRVSPATDSLIQYNPVRIAILKLPDSSRSSHRPIYTAAFMFLSKQVRSLRMVVMVARFLAS